MQLNDKLLKGLFERFLYGKGALNHYCELDLNPKSPDYLLNRELVGAIQSDALTQGRSDYLVETLEDSTLVRVWPKDEWLKSYEREQIRKAQAQSRRQVWAIELEIVTAIATGMATKMKQKDNKTTLPIAKNLYTVIKGMPYDLIPSEMRSMFKAFGIDYKAILEEIAGLPPEDKQ